MLTGGLKIPVSACRAGPRWRITPNRRPLIEASSASRHRPGRPALTFLLLKRPVAEVRELSESPHRLKERIVYCGTCFNVTDRTLPHLRRPCARTALPVRRRGAERSPGDGAHGRVSWPLSCAAGALSPLDVSARTT